MSASSHTGIRLAAVLCILCCSLASHAQEQPRIGILEFTAHTSAQNAWTDTVLEQLRAQIREELVSHDISVIPPGELPEQLPPISIYDVDKLSKSSWNNLKGVHGLTKFVIGTVENHKTGETSLSLAWIFPESGRIMKPAAITLNAGIDPSETIVRKFARYASDVIRAGAR